MKPGLRFTSAGWVLLLLSCGSPDDAVTPAPVVEKRKFWTVRDFAPENYDQTDALALIHGQPEEDKPIILTLIRQLVEESLDGIEQEDDQTKVLHMAWYVHTHFAAVSFEPYSFRSALEYRQAECGASSTIFQMMVRSLGIKTRSTGFFGVPIQAAHTTSEVFLDGAWRYIDPSFGVFFTADGSLSSELVSMDTLLTYRYTVATNTLYPIADGRLGWLEQTPKPTELENLFSKVQMDLLSSGNYKLFLEETRAASPYDLDYTMLSEFTVDLSTDRALEIGEPDHSIVDIRLYTTENTGIYDAVQLFFAGDYTGTYGPLVNSHVYYITGLHPGQTVRFRAGLVYGDPSQINIAVRKGTLKEIRRGADAIEADFTALRRDLEIKLTVNDEERILFDNLSFHR